MLFWIGLKIRHKYPENLICKSGEYFMKNSILCIFILTLVVGEAYACEATFTPEQCKTICSKSDPTTYATCMLGSQHHSQ